jgi:hypothetical protein
MPTESHLKYECDMLPVLGPSLHDVIFPSGREAHAVREAAVCGVIPDILFCQWPKTPTLRLRRPATIIEAHILAAVEKAGPCLPEDICRDLFLSQRKADESLKYLIRQGLLVFRRDGRIVIKKEAKTGSINVVAVEMKLSRWRQALVQACSYLRFANAVYVVLDGNRVKVSTSMRHEFESSGVGLLLQQGRMLEKYVRATACSPIPTAERVIATQKALSITSATALRTAAISQRHLTRLPDVSNRYARPTAALSSSSGRERVWPLFLAPSQSTLSEQEDHELK